MKSVATLGGSQKRLIGRIARRMKRHLVQAAIAVVILAWIAWAVNQCVAVQECMETTGAAAEECGGPPS